MKTLIKNVKIITPFDVLHDHSLVIEDEKIEDIIEDEKISLEDFETVIDGEGLFWLLALLIYTIMVIQDLM